jgi:hypothetical protein
MVLVVEFVAAEVLVGLEQVSQSVVKFLPVQKDFHGN